MGWRPCLRVLREAAVSIPGEYGPFIVGIVSPVFALSLSWLDQLRLSQGQLMYEDPTAMVILGALTAV